MFLQEQIKGIIIISSAVTALAQPRQGPPQWKVPAPVAADCAGIRGVYPAHAQHRRAQGRVRGRACQPRSLKGVLFFKFRTDWFSFYFYFWTVISSPTTFLSRRAGSRWQTLAPQTSSTRSRGLGRRMHESVEDTKLSTNKQHSLSWQRCVIQCGRLRQNAYRTESLIWCENNLFQRFFMITPLDA